MKSQELPKEPFSRYVLLIVAIGTVVCLFGLNHNYGKMVNLAKEQFEDSLKDYEDEVSQIKSNMEQLEQEVREIRKLLHEFWQRVETLNEVPPNSPPAGLSESPGGNLYPDSVPCCGGEDNVTNFESIQPLPEGVDSFQEAFEHIRANLPEEQRLQMEEMDRENEEFFNTLDEEGLAELERRKQEFKNKMRSQFTTMMAAMPEQVKQNWERHKHIMEESWEIAAHTTTLMDMRTDYSLPPSRIRVLKIERQKLGNNDAPQLTEEEWKMQEALRQLEEAARQQE